MWDERAEVVSKPPERTHRESEIPSEARASIHSNEVEGPAEKRRRSFKGKINSAPTCFSRAVPKLL